MTDCAIISWLACQAYAPVAQLDRVTDYESVGRGFESLPAYQKREDTKWHPLFFSPRWGLERAARAQRGQKQSGGLFLARGRIHCFPDAPAGCRREVIIAAETKMQTSPFRRAKAFKPEPFAYGRRVRVCCLSGQSDIVFACGSTGAFSCTATVLSI